METQNITLPTEVAQIAENVSVEKRIEVQNVLNSVFNGVAKMRKQLDSVTVTSETDKVNMKLANTIRLGVRQVRLDAEKTFDAKRSEVQQQMLSFKTEDALWLKAKQTMQILTKEIEENARWKEETKERFEAEQKELQTQQRITKVAKIAPEITRQEFENMSEETFTMFLNGIEKAYNEQIELARITEEERLYTEKLERERIEFQRIENERLKAEAEQMAKELEIERKHQAEILAKQKAEADEKARIEVEKQAKIQDELKAKAEKERIEKERIEAELKSKQEVEYQAELHRIESEKLAKKEAEKLAKAPDKEKLIAYIDSFSSNASFSLETIDAITICNDIQSKFESFKKWAVLQVEKLQ